MNGKTRTLTIKVNQGRGSRKVTFWIGNGGMADQELRVLDPDSLRKHKDGQLLISVPIREIIRVRDSAAISVWM
jgi:hypothetical protein